MISMVKGMHENKHSRNIKPAENFLEVFVNLFMVNGHKSNDTHPLTYTVDEQGPSSNILNHDTLMKALDSYKFKIAMPEELDTIWNNKIYEFVEKLDVLEVHTILRLV